MNWIEKYKIPCLVAVSLIGCAFATGYLLTQILYAIQVLQQLENEEGLLKQKINNVSNEVNMMRETNSTQDRLSQSQLHDMQQQLNKLKEEEVEFQRQSSVSQEEETKVEDDDMLDSTSPFYNDYDLDEEDFGF